MGGRGSASGGGAAPAIPFGSRASANPLPYTVIQPETALGGAVYPFLAQTRRAWRLVARPVDHLTEVQPAHRLGHETPTLRWVNGDQVTDLYVDGMDTQTFLQKTGLRLSLEKGGFVLSKRLSRLMRPHFVSAFLNKEEVSVAYMEQTPEEAKVWDGAGLMSRRMLRKLALSEALSPTRRARLEKELAHGGRVEFTLMTAAGQDKGHALVVDELRDENGRLVDFLLPQDTKREVALEDDRVFVGVNFVHGKNEMRLDVQSLINLHPFFDEARLHSWLGDEGERYVQGLNGEAPGALGQLDATTTLEEVESWPLREYLAGGGDPRWFATHTKSLMNRHLQRLNHQTRGTLRLPIPGGRHYVRPAAVARRAGLEIEVPRGGIHIDDARGTAWVNDDDWLALPDSAKGEGIAGILGGADHDDALWLFPFSDHDGRRQVLAWRSPNQVGEYVVLTPTRASAVPLWHDAHGGVARFPQADSRRLPPRIDRVETDYLGLVEAETTGGLGEEVETYDVAAMDAAVGRALANKGALGMYCNSLMVNKAVYGRLPEQPPAPLEEIIDSAVKTGADLSQVVAWNYANSRQILEDGTPVPAVLHPRLSVDRRGENPPPAPRPSTDHWLDRTVAGVEGHIQGLTAVRDEMAAAAKPPRALLDAAFADPEAIALGAELNRTYAAALNEPLPKRGTDRRLTRAERLERDRQRRQARFERARQTTWDYLHRFHPERHSAILRGAMTAAVLTGTSDAAVWQAGEKTADGRLPGMGHKAVSALREIGLLHDSRATPDEEKRVGVSGDAARTADYTLLRLEDAWFYQLQAQARANDLPPPQSMQAVSPAEKRRARQALAEAAPTDYRRLRLHIKEENGRKAAYGPNGRRLGTVSADTAAAVRDGQQLLLRYALGRSGGLQAVVEAVPHTDVPKTNETKP